MSVIKEMIMFAAGLMMTVFVCGISFRIYDRAEVLGEKVIEREEQNIADIMEYELTRYDDDSINGSQAISYIRRAYAEYGVNIEVKTENAEFVVDGNNLNEIRRVGSPNYINPSGNYSVNVDFDENDTVKQINIIQK